MTKVVKKILALREPLIIQRDPHRAGKIDCINCAYAGYIEELKYDPLSSMHECKCTSTYEEKRYYCKEILPGMDVLIKDPKNPPKDYCPCYTRGLEWKWNSMCRMMA